LRNKNITIIGLNFYPESTAIGLYSSQLADYLEAQGANINVITAFPYYPQWKIADAYKEKPRFVQEKRGNINLFRYKQYTPAKPTFIKRIIHIVDFTIGSYINSFKVKESDLIISVVPFTSSSYLGNILKRRHKAKHWIHIQDFEFDAAFQSGLAQGKDKKKGFVYKQLMGLEKRIFSKADMVSTISQAMIARLKEKTTSASYFLPNWIEGDKINPANSKRHSYFSSEKFKILYSGNIGDKQDWKLFEELTKELDPAIFEFIIIGDGSKRAELEASVATIDNVSLYPPVPYEELSDVLCSADLHFLFQKSEILDTVMPSKILGMMASAKPSIITGHKNSEVKTVIEESKGGYYISEDNNLKEVMAAIKELHEKKELSVKMGKGAREYVIKHFSKKQILDRFIDDLSRL
jgi:colanic acid biosynthesis glycosyl transferase WcaI